jgi:exopolysaccharide biosynthesis polyprenyl glycosylphosphotransferase
VFRRFSVDFALFSILVDALLVALSFFLADHLRPALNRLPFVAVVRGAPSVPPILYPVASFLWVLMLMMLSVYDGRKNLRLGDELRSLLLASVLATVLLAGAFYLSLREISRILFLSFAGMATLFLASWRVAAYFGRGVGVSSRARPRRVLIVGAGVVGNKLAGQIGLYRNVGLALVGFLDDSAEKGADPQARVLGTLREARQIVSQREIDDVVLALPRRAYEQVNALVAELHSLPVKVWVVPDYFQLALHHAVVEEFAGLPMLDLRAPALSEYQRMVKRVFDVMVGLILLPFALPLMGLIALAIRLDSPGPVFFRQQRAGENGKLFGMLKFRTMVAGKASWPEGPARADEKGRWIHKSADDPRVTRLGRLLRRISLDELPQLFNVLRGEMSLVGPRPEMPELVERYEPWQRKRFSVPQGITGWWQVGGRSDRPMHLHTEDDLYYVQNYSLWLDLVILLRTVGAVLSRKGAY